MPEITANIVVEPITLTVTQTSPGVNVAVDSTNLNLYTATAPSIIGGNVGELQYRAVGNVLNGIANSNVDANGNLVFTNLSNVKITGGTNGYVLQTDGTGNLSWTAQTGGGGNGAPGGSNTQIQYNDEGLFGGNVGFTFDEVTGNVDIPGNLNVVGDVVGNVVGNATYANSAGTANTVTTAAQPNITSLGTLTGLEIVGALNISSNTVFANTIDANTGNFSGNVTANVIIANSISGDITANSANTANFANFAGNATIANTANAVAGANVTGQVANALVAGTVYTAAQPNITSVGTLSNLTISNTLTVTGTDPRIDLPGTGGLITVHTGTFANITATDRANIVGNANVGNIGGTGGIFTYVTGNGANLSSLTGANVIGEVAYANNANSVSGSNVVGTQVYPAYLGSTGSNIFASGTYTWNIENEPFIDVTGFPLGSDFNLSIRMPGNATVSGSGTLLGVGDWTECSMLVTNSGANTYKLNSAWGIFGSGSTTKYYYPNTPTGYNGTILYSWKIQRIADVGLNKAYIAIVTQQDLVV